MFWYMVTGGLIFVINTLGYHYRRKVSCLIWTFFILLVFIGLRDEVGGDWVSYQKAFDSGPFVSMGILYYGAFTWIAKILDVGVIGLNFLVALVFCAGFLLIASELKNPSYFIVSVYFLFIVISGLGFTRQTLSIGFLLLAFFLARKEYVIWAAICFVLAVSAHEGAMVSFPLILGFNRKSYKHFKWTMLIVASGIALGSFIVVLSWEWIGFIFIDHYGYMPYTFMGGPTIRALIYGSLLILLLHQFFVDSGVGVSNKGFNERLILCTLIALIIPIGFVSSVISDRLLLFFGPFLILFVLERPLKIACSHLVGMCVTLICLVYFWVWSFLSPYAHFWLPYKNILFL